MGILSPELKRLACTKALGNETLPGRIIFYTSGVRPRLQDKNRVRGCNQFISVAHKLDPFTMVGTFNPAWKKGSARPRNNLKYDSFQPLSISGLTGVNPHDFEHCLEHPGTHLPLFRNLISKGVDQDKILVISRFILNS
jgi:hypothetical protein